MYAFFQWHWNRIRMVLGKQSNVKFVSIIDIDIEIESVADADADADEEDDDDDDDDCSVDSSDDEAIIKRMKLVATKKNKKKT